MYGCRHLRYPYLKKLELMHYVPNLMWPRHVLDTIDSENGLLLKANIFQIIPSLLRYRGIFDCDNSTLSDL